MKKLSDPRHLQGKRLLFGWMLGFMVGVGLITANAQPGKSDPVISSIRIEEGSISYMSAGPGDGEKVILLHGLFAQKEQWIEVAKILGSRGYSVIVPDLPGYGASGEYDISAYSLERQRSLLGAFLDTLDAAKTEAGTRSRGVHIAGNSMGGAIALLYAEAFPDRVLSLAFIGAPLGAVPFAPPVQEAIKKGTNPFIPLSADEFRLELSLLLVNPPELPEDSAQAMVGAYTARERHYRQVWDIVNLYSGLFTSRRSLPPHTLILWGEKDRIFPATGVETLRRLVPPQSARILPGAGHLPHLEAPTLVADAYIEFLSSLRH